MIAREDLIKMSRQEVGKLLRQKQLNCRTIAQEVEMYHSDPEYTATRERLEEIITEDLRGDKQRCAKSNMIATSSTTDEEVYRIETTTDGKIRWFGVYSGEHKA